MTPQITFQPSGHRAETGDGQTVLGAAQGSGEGIVSTCAGKGVCGKCRVVAESGGFTPPTPEELEQIAPEDIIKGVRLACMARPLSDAVVFVPEGSRIHRQVVLGGDPGRVFTVEPSLTKHYIEPDPPTGSGNASDAERVRSSLTAGPGRWPHISFSLDALRRLPRVLRDGGYKATLTLRDRHEITDVEPGFSDGLFGAAIDVGTTTIAGQLCDLSTGKVIASESAANPQIPMGEDVMSRIEYAIHTDGGAGRLQAVLLDELDLMLKRLAGAAPTGRISETVLVGNTVMLHLLLGLDTSMLGSYPFTPVITGAVEVGPGELGGWVRAAGRVTTLPMVGGFVGADLVGVLASLPESPPGETTLVVDLGTNGELALLRDGSILVTSCATGPAFEGAGIRHGMRAADGAIDRVLVDPDTREVTFGVIGYNNVSKPDSPSGARGICGSGLVDAVAGMLRAGVMDDKGSMEGPGSHPRLIKGTRGDTEFVIARPAESATGGAVTVSQSDVRSLQLAKAAIAAGSAVLMLELGAKRVDRVLLAGAFGNFIGAGSASALGMFPDCPPDKIAPIGNAALDGAMAALLSQGVRARAHSIAVAARRVELGTHPDFERLFLDAAGFPE